MSQRQQLLNLPLHEELTPALQKLQRCETILLRVLYVKGVLLLGALLFFFFAPEMLIPQRLFYIRGILGLVLSIGTLAGVRPELLTRPGKALLLAVAARRSEVNTEQASWGLDILIATQYLGRLDDRMSGARQQLETTLLKLLPKLNQVQCLAFTKAQRGYLRRWVKNGHPGQQVAALLVLASAQDIQITKHAQWLLTDSAAADPRVREAAHEFLLVVGE